MIVILSGCSTVGEVSKTIWGSSTRVLEQERINALTKVYDKDYWTILKTAVTYLENKGYIVFKKDEVRGVLIVMGVPGAVNTTEVGVFFVELNDNQTRVELTSLSTNAKRLLSNSLFHGLDVAFGLAPADKQYGVKKLDFIALGANGTRIYEFLLNKKFLKEISETEAQFEDDPVKIQNDLKQEFPDEFDKAFAILTKAMEEKPEQAAQENQQP